VVIDAYAPADKPEEFLPKAEKVLDTVEWKGVQAFEAGGTGDQRPLVAAFGTNF
jgi:hypothetical protein